MQRVKDNVTIDTYRKQLMDLVKKEEILWRQRSKCLWLKEGDRNAKFFHAAASCKKRNNRVSRIMDEDDKWYKKKEDITRMFLDCFHKIYTSSQPTCIEMIFHAMERKIGYKTNAMFLRDFTKEEIKMTLDQMHLDKALGPDGMTVGFYKRYWNIVC